MTVYPPTPLKWQNKLALDNTHSQLAYVGYDGTVFHLSGPFAPVLGAQAGVALAGSISGLMPPFMHLDNKGARQDGTSWYDSLYDEAEITMMIEIGANTPAEMRKTIGSWLGAWDAKKQGKLCWYSPERGEWWAPVRLSKNVPDQIPADWYQSKKLNLTWSARNDQAFWQSVDSVSTFTTGAAQTVSVQGATGGTYTLSFGGLFTVDIPYNSSAEFIQTALEDLASIGTGNVSVSNLSGSNSLFSVLFQEALGAIAQPILTAVSSLTGGNVLIDITQTGGTTVSGHLNLTNIGDQPAWPRYLCYGPGTFLIGDGPGSQNMVSFGPLLDGQVALLNTLPRLPGVIDLTPPGGPQASQSQGGSEFGNLLAKLISFATNNNVPPLLQQFESLFGIMPPQGTLYSLLNGRFTQPIPPMLEQEGPQTSQIACQIQGGSSSSKIIAAVTPQRRWPE